jgi:hypothetical protein
MICTLKANKYYFQLRLKHLLNQAPQVFFLHTIHNNLIRRFCQDRYLTVQLLKMTNHVSLVLGISFRIIKTLSFFYL